MPLEGADLRTRRGRRRAGRLDATGVRGRPLSRLDAALGQARDLLLAGDRQRLLRLLEEDPDLVRRRFLDERPPYDGYFHGATLLHHVAGNPQIADLPDDICDLTRLLLERGADVDAVTRQGPRQPDDIGWTTLGLVASSEAARRSGQQTRLMDVLLDAGADPDARNGGCIMGALFYGESGAAEHLARCGARLDVIAAAGVGDTARLEGMLSGAELPPPLVHYSPVPWPADAGRDETLALALAYAALHGRMQALELLLDRGAEPDAPAPMNGSPLHWAVLGDHPAVVRVLLEAGADPEARDDEHGSTPLEWARHLDRRAAVRALT